MKQFFEKLGFRGEGILEKKYNNYSIKIDLKKGKIFYRDDNVLNKNLEIKRDNKINIGDKTSSHFKPKGDLNQESLIVLYGVDLLLEKGYKPDDIFIERKYKLGHTGKSGKSDITIFNKEDEAFLIIEVKKSGYEFEKEKKRLEKDGGQLFSYLGTDQNVKYLSLFTAQLEEGLDYTSLIIKIIDDEEKLKECEKKEDKKGCAYKYASNNIEYFKVWKKIYNSFYFSNGVFEKDSGLYDLELLPLKKKNLKTLQTSKGLFNEFAEILRHNQISDNSNAFNKMLSLILCKIVDEDEKSEDEVLDFQVKEGQKDEDLLDKLMRLYQIGMSKYLGIEDFVYHSDEEIQDKIKNYPTRKNLLDIIEIFKEVKYYTDSTFAFKEVYNKRLFQENALVLKEVISMLQNYRFKNNTKSQFLGDFFELLLNHGVKQSEGQFFTPIPIVRFITKSLDLKDMYPFKIVDYACGAGHFLIEAINEIKNTPNLEQFSKENIFGIEKDYRLARAAKIACFLNSEAEANVIYGDGLKSHEILKEDIKKFDILATNPPYSVKNFKNYLDDEVLESFELSKFLGENSKEIEVLFIERAKQLLKEHGRCAIILPSSILSNTGIYTKARELVLKYFDIIAITELGNKTFIATGTNTIVWFLERKKDNFEYDFNKISEEIFSEFQFYEYDEYDTKKLYREFLKFRGFNEKFDKLLQNNRLSKEFFELEIIKEYLKIFSKKQHKNFASFVKNKEKEKFFYFCLAYNKKVVVIKSPTQNDAQKEFLGYEFNKKRGFEGIEIYLDEEGKEKTALYDENDNPKKANYYIKSAYNKIYPEIKTDFVKYLNLVDMLDFNVNFEKVINTNIVQKESWKYPTKKLGEVSELIRGVTYSKEQQVTKSDIKILTADNIRLDNELEINKIIYLKDDIKISSQKKLLKNDIFICLSSGSLKHIGKVAFINEDIDFYSGGFMGIIRTNNEKTSKYLFEILKYFKYKFEDIAKGSNINNLSSIINKIDIPFPKLSIQKEIISKIEEIEKKENKLKQENKKLQKEIKEIVLGIKGESKKIGSILEKIKGNTTKIQKNEILSKGKYPVITQEADKFISGYTNNENVISDIPLVVFGDHSCTFKYVDFEFIRGADGTQLLKPNSDFEVKYFFYVLKHLNIPHQDKYTRHMKYLKDLTIPYIDKNQQKQIITQIEQKETIISKNNLFLDEAKNKKTKILREYLKG